MKTIILLPIFTLFLSASEFTHIQPIAVEEAPVKVLIKETIIIKEVPKKSTANSSNFSEKLVLKDDGTTKTMTLEINFATNRYDISNKYIDNIKECATYLEENDDSLIVIYGYTDSIGSDTRNKKLSQNRANSVQKALEEYGIQSMRVTTIGRGELNPIADNSTKTGRAKNRRIEIDILE